MEAFQEYVDEYRTQIEKGAIKKAYKGLMEYVQSLRTDLITSIPIILCLGVFILGIWI